MTISSGIELLLLEMGVSLFRNAQYYHERPLFNVVGCRQ